MAGRRAARAAFTLVELILTVAVVGIVLVVLADATQYVRNQGMARFTQDVLLRAGVALAEYRGKNNGLYPPDKFSGVRPTASHRPLTEGVECLVLALDGDGDDFWRDGPFKRAAGNTDADRDAGEPGKAGGVGSPVSLWELLDGWGRPLLYYNGYGARPGSPGNPLTVGDRRENWQRQLNKSLADRWVQGDSRPLLDSAGPDGVFNTSDDLQLPDLPAAGASHGVASRPIGPEP